MTTTGTSDTDTRRNRILGSAEKIMAKKGAKATISEIARSADVYESTIYHYFKNKEDLLFSVAEEQTGKWMLSLKGGLDDMEDPLQKIRRVIGWQLQRFDAEPDFASIVLYQCRSRRNFYTHSAFEQIGQLRLIFETVLEEGIQTGNFRSDINKPALWYFVFGLTDMSYLLSNPSSSSHKVHADLDLIMDLIQPMIRSRSDKGDRKLEKTGKILNAAERMFAEKGFEHTKIQEIAGAAGVADGSIYAYFANKDDLLFSIIEDGFMESPFKQGFKEHLFATKLFMKESILDEVKRFIRQLFFIALIQPDFAKVLVMHGIYNEQFYHTEAFKRFLAYLSTLEDILEEGKAEGLFRAEVDNRVFRNMVLGVFSLSVLRWFLQDEGHKRDKVKEIDLLITYLVTAITKSG